ncbi:MAG: DUF3540 domain-containing protein [Polyangiaceae bacterium]
MANTAKIEDDAAKPLEVIEGEGHALDARGLSVVTASELLVGPARVREVGPSFVLVEAAGRAALERAELAFAQPYVPAVGDLLVVMGRPGELYAVGVLRGRGHTTLSVEGDLSLKASGTLHLTGRQGIVLEGEEISVEAGKIQTVARAAVEVFGSLVQRVSGLISQKGRDVHVEADESHVTRAKNATIVTEENVVVNGKQLFLG